MRACRFDNEGILTRVATRQQGVHVRVGIAADHGGLGLKEVLRGRLAAAGHGVVAFGANRLERSDDYLNFVTPLARAVASGTVERGVAACGSGVGASVCVNKVPGVRAALINDHFSARQEVAALENKADGELEADTSIIPA